VKRLWTGLFGQSIAQAPVQTGAISRVSEQVELNKDQRRERAAETGVQRPARSLKVTLTAIGNLDNTCPACGTGLSKRPTRKTKCPHCAAFIFVRTRPLDRQRVLVTEEQSLRLEAEWASFPRVRIRPTLDDEEMTRVRQRLAEQFGRPPSEADITWAYLNQKTIDYAKYRKWGLYRNTRLSMAAVLEQEGRLRPALRHYLEVCYLDLNGAQNRIQIVTDGKTMIGPGHDFVREHAFLAPAVVAKIIEMILSLKLDEHEVKDDFVHFAGREIPNLKLEPPLSTERVWKELSAELYI
jgi:uncharacterized Zn finger protein (UPF0148 family)